MCACHDSQGKETLHDVHGKSLGLLSDFKISRCGCTVLNKLSFRACSNTREREENTEAFEVNCECSTLMMIAWYFFSERNAEKHFSTHSRN